MIVRIVKMVFREGEAENFMKVFNESCDKIRSFPGCQHLTLLKGEEEQNTFFTYSYWESPSDLEAYRQSALFQVTWEQTKALFADKAQAWTLNKEWESA